jgi:Right handed beta helix region
MLALEVSLALIVAGGAASVLVEHLSLASAHKALPSGTRPASAGPASARPTSAGRASGGPTELGATEIGATEIGASGTARGACDCVTAPHACGFPDGTDTGVPSGTALRSVPSQVSSGPGWHYNAADGDVVVDVNRTVLSGLYIPYDLVIDASDVTVRDVKVMAGGYFGISLRHTKDVTIEDSTISGQNLTSGRVGAAIDDIYGDSTGIVIKDNNISEFRTGVQVSSGLIADNYIHDPGYIHGDHTNGIYVGGTTRPLMIYGNTIFNNLGETDDINLDASSSKQEVANKSVVDNLLAGGDYSIYGGDSRHDHTSNIVIKDNEFGQLYYPKGGQYGPAAYVNLRQAGNVWSGNVWSGISRAGHAAACGGLRPVDLPAAAG